jgi:hypothetical protein
MSAFIPEIWSREMVRFLRDASALDRVTRGSLADHLDPKDFWNGEDGGSYEEAVAFSRIAGVKVAKTHTRKDGMYLEEFVLHRPGAPHRRRPICSPAELITELKRYVADYPPEDSDA